MSITGHVAMAQDAGAGIAVVDVIGIGAGVYDRLREQNRKTVPFNAGEKSSRTDKSKRLRFANKRAAAWWGMRELLDPAYDSTVALPPDRMLIDELSAPRWKPTSNGRVQIESKDQIKRRLRRSTDNADAVIQAFWESGQQGGLGAVDQETLAAPSRWTGTRRSTRSRWKRTKR